MNSRPPGRVLIISFSFRPLNNPRAHRWSMLAERLAASGELVDVVTSWQPDAAALEVSGSLTVHRVGNPLVERVRGAMRGARHVAGAASPCGKRPSALAAFRRALTGLALGLWRSLHWPDASCLWYWPARRQVLSLLGSHRYDMVVSVSPAFTGVLLGLRTRFAAGEAAWLLDIGDPFSFLAESPPNNSRLYGWLNRHVEDDALRRASCVAVTNENVRRRYIEAFAHVAAKMEVIPPLLSLGPAQELPEGYLRAGRRSMVYVGTLYRGLREPTFLLELYRRAVEARLLGDCDLHFFGDASACVDVIDRYRAALGDALRVHGLVEREIVAAAMSAADVLVNIGNESLTQLPSKVVEYASTGRPVVNLAASEQDTSVAFFAGYPNALNIIHHGARASAEQARALAAFIDSAPARVPAPVLQEFLAPYRPEAVVERYRSILGRARAGRLP